MKKRTKILTAICASAALIAAGAYAGTAYYYSRHFYNNTKINGLDCSGKTAEQVKERLEGQISSYRLKIVTQDGSEESLTASQVGLSYADDRAVDKVLKEQDALLWIFQQTKKRDHTLKLPSSYSVEKVRTAAESLSCMQNMTAPADARMQDNPDGFGCTIVPEVMGSQLDSEAVVETLCSALNSREERVSLEEEGCYVRPKILQDNPELVAAANAVNEEAARILSPQITMQIGSSGETITQDMLKTWVYKDEAGHYQYNRELVNSWVDQIADGYDSYGAKRPFKTSLGNTVNVVYKTYGWKMNRDATKELVWEKLNAAASETIEPVYAQTGKNRNGNPDLGDNYVEISIANQRMWYYKDGKLLVDTPIVSGCVANGHATPSGGVWKINYKASPYIMKGEIMANGEREYETPCDYWLPFNGGIGIHDLASRTAFGGSIYKTNGSHGCINTPYDKVQTIYRNITAGTPVVVW